MGLANFLSLLQTVLIYSMAHVWHMRVAPFRHEPEYKRTNRGINLSPMQRKGICGDAIAPRGNRMKFQLVPQSVMSASTSSGNAQHLLDAHLRP
jgi:hypothetical protein